MDRRRFIPSHEALEGRALQATNLTNIFGAQINSNLNIPITYEQKALRIQRLPYYLDKISEGPAFCPKPRSQQIQNSLYAMLDTIDQAPLRGAQQLQLPASPCRLAPVAQRVRHQSPQLLLRGGSSFGQDARKPRSMGCSRPCSP